MLNFCDFADYGTCRKKGLTYGFFKPYNITVRIKTGIKTVMETVVCLRKRQRAGEGGSPVPVEAEEDHSGVSVPKSVFSG